MRPRVCDTRLPTIGPPFFAALRGDGPSVRYSVCTAQWVSKQRAVGGEESEQREGGNETQQQTYGGPAHGPGQRWSGQQSIARELSHHDGDNEDKDVGHKRVFDEGRVRVEQGDDGGWNEEQRGGPGNDEVAGDPSQPPVLDEGVEEGRPEAELEVLPHALIHRGDDGRQGATRWTMRRRSGARLRRGL